MRNCTITGENDMHSFPKLNPVVVFLKCKNNTYKNQCLKN